MRLLENTDTKVDATLIKLDTRPSVFTDGGIMATNKAARTHRGVPETEVSSSSVGAFMS